MIPELLIALVQVEVPPSQLVTVANGRDIFPRHFQGVWAPSLEQCNNPNSLELTEITADRRLNYESEGVLLKVSGTIHQSTPDGREAVTVNALEAWSGEGQVGIGQVRLSRVGDLLYMSNPEAATESDHWTFANVRCPSNAR